MTGTENIFDQLRAIQDQHGYLPAAELQTLSKSSGVPLYHLHGVADFYPHFHLVPPPKLTVRVCSDMSCHLRGADPLRIELKKRLAAVNDIAVQEVSCLGQCDGAPAASINDSIFRNVSVAQLEALAISALANVGQASSLQRGFQAAPPPAPDKTDPPFDLEPYRAIRTLLETRDYDGAIAQLKASGLPGLGGAGFPTGMKWEAVRKAPGPTKYVVCNADESEPGTIKDRFIMEHLPHLVIEGMIIAGLVTGAQRGILYIRHEYEAQEKILEAEIHNCYESGLLGAKIGFDLEIFVSPGGYICGEETALIEAIEGKRAEPRNKPPFPVISGLWNKPTALNNVETFANVPQILVNGIDWYKSQGQNGAAGLKFVGVSGDVVNPGIFIIPMGLPMSDVIFGHAAGIRDGKRLKAFAPSGPSSGYLPASMVDVRLDFKSLAVIGSMLGSGAIVVCAEGTCMLDMALNACTFFRNESCGKCVPCRMGSQKMVDILTGWTQGEGTPRDLQLIDELSEAMKLASICGLGQFAHSPITSVLKHFRQEIEEHIVHHRCPENVCPMNRPGARPLIPGP